MSDTRWPEIGGKELRYADHDWKLTGTVDVRDTGDVLHVEARQEDGVRHRSAILRFGLEDPPASLNPGDLGGHFDRLELDNGHWHLVIKNESGVYWYELQGVRRL